MHATKQLLRAALVSLTSSNTSRFGLSFNSLFTTIPLNIKLCKYVADILQLLPIMKSIQFICPSWSLSLTFSPVGWRLIYNCSVCCPVHRSITSLCDLKEEQNIHCLLCTQTYHKTVWYTAQCEIFCGLLVLEQLNKNSKITIMVPILQVLEGIRLSAPSLQIGNIYVNRWNGTSPFSTNQKRLVQMCKNWSNPLDETGLDPWKKRLWKPMIHNGAWGKKDDLISFWLSEKGSHWTAATCSLCLFVSGHPIALTH